MRLALVIPGFQADPSDWCIPAFTNLAQELSKWAEVHVFALRYPHFRRRYKIGPVHVHALNGGALVGFRLTGASLLKLWFDTISAIEAEHRRASFDAITGIWATESGWLATHAAKRLGIPCLVHLAGGELTWLPSIRYGNWGRGLAGRLVKASLHNADLLTVPSGYVWEQLAARSPSSLSKAIRWSPGVDTTLFSPASQDTQSGPFTFVTAGSLIPVKCHQWLLEGMAALRQSSPETHARLKIVGSGPLRPQLERAISNSNLEGYVTLMGEVHHEHLPDLYRNADCFILSSRHEAQCMALLEAMSCGLPWLGPRVGAIADIPSLHTEAKSGILVKERNPNTLAAAMLNMINLPDGQHQAMGASARAIIERHYSLQTQTRRLVELFSTL